MKTIFPTTPAMNAAFALLAASPSFALELSIPMVEAEKDECVEIPLTVHNGLNITSAAFTVTFNTTALEVEATSEFFPSIADQLDESSEVAPILLVDDVSLLSTFVTAPKSNGIALAGMRLGPAPAGSAMIATLAVKLKAGQPAGTYDIDIVPTEMTTAVAGYSDGEKLHLVRGVDNAVLLSRTDYADAVVPGFVKFEEGAVDSDGDGLIDSWELEFFGDLTSTAGREDGDGDGRNDLLELFMGSDPTVSETTLGLIPALDAEGFKVYFPRSKNNELPFALEWTEDLQTWTGEGIVLAVRADLGETDDWVMIEASVPSADRARAFARLVIGE
jgi:hypothetical protein